MNGYSNCNDGELSVQVLVATMNCKSEVSLLKSLNIQTDAIVGNQCTEMIPPETFKRSCYNGNNILWLNFEERGVGLNRNNALMRSKSDIIIFADDDMTFLDGYDVVTRRLFSEYPSADIIIFNINNRRKTLKNHFTKKCGYGCARIACRRESIMKYGIFFNLNYGGGALYSYGEDSLFLAECLKKGLKILAVTDEIAHLNDDRPSTWFNGYSEKYYYDSGNLIAALGVKFPLIIILKDLLMGKITSENIRVAKLRIKGFLDYKKNNRMNQFKCYDNI